MHILITISCSQSPKDVDELKEEVQEARRVKMLHCPSKVNLNAHCTSAPRYCSNCKLYFPHLAHFKPFIDYIWIL